MLGECTLRAGEWKGYKQQRLRFSSALNKENVAGVWADTAEQTTPAKKRGTYLKCSSICGSLPREMPLNERFLQPPVELRRRKNRRDRLVKQGPCRSNPFRRVWPRANRSRHEFSFFSAARGRKSKSCTLQTTRGTRGLILNANVQKCEL